MDQGGQSAISLGAASGSQNSRADRSRLLILLREDPCLANMYCGGGPISLASMFESELRQDPEKGLSVSRTYTFDKHPGVVWALQLSLRTDDPLPGGVSSTTPSESASASASVLTTGVDGVSVGAGTSASTSTSTSKAFSSDGSVVRLDEPTMMLAAFRNHMPQLARAQRLVFRLDRDEVLGSLLQPGPDGQPALCSVRVPWPVDPSGGTIELVLDAKLQRTEMSGQPTRQPLDDFLLSMFRQ